MVAIFFFILIIFFSVGDALIVLPDKRKVHIIKNDILLDAVGDFIVDRVEELAVEAISKKDSFSISIGSGTTVKPLVALADRNVDISKVHIFEDFKFSPKIERIFERFCEERAKHCTKKVFFLTCSNPL